MGVGKSCLLLRFADDTFTESYIATIGVDFRFRTVTVDGQRIKLQIWDTAGQERFRTLTNAYYRGADGVMLVYDVTNQESFDHLEDWMEEVQRFEQQRTVKLLVGNKSDLCGQHRVTTDQLAHKASLLKVQGLETSAKSAYQVESAFVLMAQQLLERQSCFPPKPPRVVLAAEPKHLDCCT